MSTTLRKTYDRYLWLNRCPSAVNVSFLNGLFHSSIKDKIDNRKFGSLTNSSSTHALVTLVHHLLQETDGTGNWVRVFVLDFSKAFDRIDYILLRKLATMDVPQILVNWVRSFLTNRKQRVKLNSFVSDWRAVNGGVLQGTVLDPIFSWWWLTIFNCILI